MSLASLTERRQLGHEEHKVDFVKIQLLSTGRATPKHVVSTASFERDFGLPNGQLEAATKVVSRFHCVDETQVDLAIAACVAAIESSDRALRDIDLIICASAVSYQPIPTMAPLVMRELGMKDGQASAFDVNSTCLSFLTALETAASRCALGLSTCALVVSAERASCALPWQDDPEVAALFGDGAGAAIITRSGWQDTGEIIAARMCSYPSAWEACSIGAGGTRYNLETDHEAFCQNAQFYMDGKELFRITSRHFTDFLGSLLDDAGWARDDVDLVIPHQASPAALEHLIRQSGFSTDRVINIVAEVGNQVAASIPFALDRAHREGRIERGDKLLMIGTSAGVSLGGMAVVW